MTEHILTFFFYIKIVWIYSSHSAYQQTKPQGPRTISRTRQRQVGMDVWPQAPKLSEAAAALGFISPSSSFGGRRTRVPRKTDKTDIWHVFSVMGKQQLYVTCKSIVMKYICSKLFWCCDMKLDIVFYSVCPHDEAWNVCNNDAIFWYYWAFPPRRMK